MVGHESIRVKRRIGQKHEIHYKRENCQANGKKQQNMNIEFIKGIQWL